MKQGYDSDAFLDDKAPTYAPAGAGASTSLFVALYLVILAFFIMLNSISTIKKDESREIMDGLKDSFSDAEKDYETSMFTTFNSAGKDISVQDYAARIGEVAKDSVSMMNIKIEHFGNTIKISTPTEHLFMKNKSTIKFEHDSFFRNIAEEINKLRGFVRFDIEFLIGSQDKTIKHSALSVERSAKFALTLEKANVDPASILVGVDNNLSPYQTEIYFNAYSIDQQRLPRGELTLEIENEQK
jgi:hypothetical protein